jgi:hypothetical protein
MRIMRVLCAMILAVLLSAAAAPAQQTHESSSQARTKSSVTTAGAIRDGIYHNPAFAFTYKLPFGWVDRTQDMQPDVNDPSSGQVLLAFFEHPPEVTAATTNSAIVVATEPVSEYHGLKTAADYFGPLDEVTTAKGFQAQGDPYEFPVGSKRLVRGDFSKQKGALTMLQTSLVTLEKGQIVSFTFIASSDDEMNDLLARLSFSHSASLRSAGPRSSGSKH